MKQILTLLLILLFNFSSNAVDFTCPPPAFLVEYSSPASGNRVKSCQQSIQGKFIKHGWTVEYSSSGEIINKDLFDNDQLIQHKPVEIRSAPVDAAAKYYSFSDVICRASAEGKLSCFKRSYKMQRGFEPFQWPITVNDIIPLESYQEYCSLAPNFTVLCQKGDKNKIDVRFLKSPKKVEVGNHYVCAQLDESSINCESRYAESESVENQTQSFKVILENNSLSIVDFELSYAHGLYLTICLLTTDKKVFCKSRLTNARGEMSLTDADKINLPDIKKFQMRQNTACALDEKQRMFCWQFIEQDGKFITQGPVELSFDATIRSFELGGARLGCAILENQKVECFVPGSLVEHGNKFTNFETSTTNETSIRKIKNFSLSSNTGIISVGLWFACAEQASGKMKCFENFLNEAQPIEFNIEF